MKRILLSLVLISASFSCKAMNRIGYDKFTELEQAYSNAPRSITENRVLDALTDNDYLIDYADPLIALAEKMQTDDLLVETIELLDKSPSQAPDWQTIDNGKALLRVILFAHQYAKGHNTEQLITSNTVESTLDLFSSFNSTDPNNDSFFSSALLQKVGFAAGLIIAGLLTNYAYTKITSSKKAN